ncbi:MAG: hypothetical protein AAB874_04740, partial [Patescibacteria group bacterium]
PSFLLLSYILAPFQAYASIKGFLETQEGPWFRTPKTGKITDIYRRGKFYHWLSGLFGRPASSDSMVNNLRVSFKLTERFVYKPIKKYYILNNFLNRITGRALTSLFLIISILIANSVSLTRIDEPNLINVKPVFASTQGFSSSTGSPMILPDKDARREMTTTHAVRFGLAGNNYLKADGEKGSLEYIFHPKPRIQTVLNDKEIDQRFSKILGAKRSAQVNAYREKGVYYYENLADGVNFRAKAANATLTEEIVVKEPVNFEGIEFDLSLNGLTPHLEGDKIIFTVENSNTPIITYEAPFMYEENNPLNRNFGIEYQLEKTGSGWKVRKMLTNEGLKWFQDKERLFPVIIDPTQVTSVIQGSITAAESDYGSPQRNIQFFPSATGGAAWYVVYQDGGLIVVEKCAQSSNCDANGDWSVVDSDLDSNDVDTDNESPSTYKVGDYLHVAWFDDSRNAYQTGRIDTTADTSDSKCNGNTLGTIADAIISITANSTSAVAFIANSGLSGSTADRISRVTYSSCGESGITTGSGFDQGDYPELMMIGSNIFMLFAADNGLRFSAYVDDGSPGWDTADTDVNGVAADNTTTDMSAVSDGTDIWVMQRNGTSGDSESFKCSACPTTGQTWTDLAEPWGSGLSSTTFVGLSYMSTPNDLVAAMMSGTGTSTVVNFKSTDADTISWSTNNTFGFAPGASGLDNFSMTANVVDDTQVAGVVLEATNSEYEFSTLPENLWLFMAGLPVVIFTKYRKKKYA